MYQAITQDSSLTQLSTCVKDCARTAPSRSWFNVSMSTSALVSTFERHSSVSWRETSHSSASLLVECLNLNTSHHRVSHYFIFYTILVFEQGFWKLLWYYDVICAFKVASSLHCCLVMACCQVNTAEKTRLLRHGSLKLRMGLSALQLKTMWLTVMIIYLAVCYFCF